MSPCAPWWPTRHLGAWLDSMVANKALLVNWPPWNKKEAGCEVDGKHSTTTDKSSIGKILQVPTYYLATEEKQKPLSKHLETTNRLISDIRKTRSQPTCLDHQIPSWQSPWMNKYAPVTVGAFGSLSHSCPPSEIWVWNLCSRSI